MESRRVSCIRLIRLKALLEECHAEKKKRKEIQKKIVNSLR